MKRKVFHLSLITASILNAGQPMVPSSMSTDKGGTKTAIDAYSDGAGVNLYNYENRPILDNSPMNELVFKYGEDAKLNAVTIQNEVKTVSPSATVYDKDLADKLSSLANPIAQSDIKTGSCDDGDPKTINDIYVNGVCIGTNVEGQSCSDGNIQTINDVWHNGICTGIFPTSCKELLTAGLSNGSGIYSISFNNSTINVYCDMAYDGGGWTYLNSSMNIASAGTTSMSSDLKTLSIYPSKSLIDGNHYGAALLFNTPSYKEVAYNQTSGSVGYVCAGPLWNTIIAVGNQNMAFGTGSYYYPYWGASYDVNSISNVQNLISVGANNSTIKSVYGTSFSRINVGAGGFSGCTNTTRTLSVKVR